MIDALTKGARARPRADRPLIFFPRASAVRTRCLTGVSARARAVLVSLYEEPEKPQNAVEFIKMALGAPTGTDVEALKSENEQLKIKAESLEKELADAKAKLGELAPGE